MPGKHKERTGKTVFGKILQSIGKSLPELASDVFNVVTSPNPFGAVMDTLKSKLASSQTGAVGDNFNNELDNISEDDKELFLASLADVAGARDMYKSSDHTQADKVADIIMKKNLQYIAVLVLVNISVMVFSEKLQLNTALIVAIGNVLGMVIQSLINERQQVVGFYMGSSLGSKIKDKTKSIFGNSKYPE